MISRIQIFVYHLSKPKFEAQHASSSLKRALDLDYDQVEEKLVLYFENNKGKAEEEYILHNMSEMYEYKEDKSS